MSQIEAKLKEMGLVLPEPLPSAGSYLPWVKAAPLVFISGQVPVKAGKIIQGVIGKTISLQDGQEAAKICALHLLAQLKQACDGDLNQAQRCIRLGGFVNAAPDFGDHPEIINGASDLICAVMGEAGRHARFAVGAESLPRQCAVEIEAVFQIKN